MRTLIAGLLAGLLLLLVPNLSEGAVYLKIDGIAGEETVQGREGWIRVDSWTWGAYNPGFCDYDSRGRAEFAQLVITKGIDKATPLLMKRVSDPVGAIASVTLEIERGSSGDVLPVTYLQYKLADCLITDFRYAGSGHSGDVPTEQFSISFGAIRQTYFRHSPQGQLIEAITEGTVVCDKSTIPPPPPGADGASVVDSIAITGPPSSGAMTSEAE